MKSTGSNRAHALLSPSSAHRWLVCPASLPWNADRGRTTAAAAIEGTACHTIAETAIRYFLDGKTYDLEALRPTPGRAAVVRDQGEGEIVINSDAAPGDIQITADMLDMVIKYYNYCTNIAAAAEVVSVEQRVRLSRVLHPGAELHGEKLQTFGTADLTALLKNDDGHTLLVCDLKTGRHLVYARKNPQLMLYAAGLMKLYATTYNITKIIISIFQPLAGAEADEWTTTPEDLEIFTNMASWQAVRALDAYRRGTDALTAADYVATGTACQWCVYAEQCDAKRKSVTAITDKAIEFNNIDTVLLKKEWDKLPLLRQHIADVEKAVYSALSRGERVEGLKLVAGRAGPRQWVADANAITAELTRHGVSADVLYKKAQLSPTELEKAVAKPVWQSLASYCTRKSGAPAIAPEHDKRPSWSAVTDADLA
jgi:hypothetical protein